MEKYCAYYRVSTKKQGVSGLGIEAQIKICTDYVERQNGEIVTQFKDYESGKSHTRKGLWDAISYCKENNTTLIIAKLDRLARDVEFTFKIVNTGIKIVFCDMPVVNSMILGVFASVAQYERELISQRTKEALQRKKSEGLILGRPKGKKNSHYKLDGCEFMIVSMLNKGYTKKSISEHLGVSISTLYQFMKDKKIEF